MKSISSYLNSPKDASALAVIRIIFGALMLFAIIRFWFNGWIEKFYIKPTFFFSYYGFDFIKPLGNYTYLIFFVCFLSCIFIILGYKYRLSMAVFFLSFTYIELMDKSVYLNHYYFVSIASFLMFFLPLNQSLSIDSYKKNFPKKVPRWTIDSLKLLVSIVYIYAGLAKINSDWLLEAVPLKIWLSSKENIPFIGYFFKFSWSYYLFSWFGMIYDLVIPFLLLSKSTRLIGFALVLVFHLLTKILFPIGLFPYIMIGFSLIFFSENWHIRLSVFIKQLLKPKSSNSKKGMYHYSGVFKHLTYSVLICFFTFQILFPFRYLLYPRELFWTEEGYRFSWRVMLIEKTGFTEFRIVDKSTQDSFYVDNSNFLTKFQEKQMSTQPDFMIEYAHFLKKYYSKKLKNENIGVFVKSLVSLNGREKRPYIDSKTDLSNCQRSFAHKSYILPLGDEIKGF